LEVNLSKFRQLSNNKENYNNKPLPKPQLQIKKNSELLPNYFHYSNIKLSFGTNTNDSVPIGGYNNGLRKINDVLITPINKNHTESIPASILLAYNDKNLLNALLEKIKITTNVEFVTIPDSTENVSEELEKILTEARAKYIQNKKRTIVIINNAEKILGMSIAYAKKYADTKMDESDLAYLSTLKNNTRNITYFKSLLDHIHKEPESKNEGIKSATTIIMSSDKPHLIHTDLTSRKEKVNTIFVPGLKYFRGEKFIADPQKVIDSSYKSREIPDSINNHSDSWHKGEKIGDVLKKANYYKNLRDFHTEEMIYDNDIKGYFELIGDKDALGSCYALIGDTCAVQGKFKDAEGCYNKALETYGRNFSHQGIADIYRKIGDMCALQEKYKTAEKCYNEAITYLNAYVGKEETTLKSKLYNKIGNVCAEQGKYKDAEACYNKIFELDKDFLSESVRIRILQKIGDICGLMGKFKDANNCYKYAEKLQSEVSKYLSHIH